MNTDEFSAYARKSGTSLVVTIPNTSRRALNIAPNTLLKVSIKKGDSDEQTTKTEPNNPQ